MNRFLLFLSLLCASGLLAARGRGDETSSATPARLPDADRTRLAEGFRLAETLGNRLWPDWDKASFAVLLVTAEHEFLVRHPKPSDDFQLVGADALLQSKVWVRKRQHAPTLLATFPAVGGVPTIVIGQAEGTTAKTSTRWVITLLHEHFHQLQYAQPRYYADVDALGLARADQTGMWMLNFPFPYAKREVGELFAALGGQLVAVQEAKERADFDRKLDSYLQSKAKLRALLSRDDYAYMAFQTWQEGIARFTEIRLAELAAEDYTPTKAFQDLKDFTSFEAEAQALLKTVRSELASVRLDKAQRTAFYALGAGEGLALDRAHPGWRKRYFEEKFSLDRHFETAK